MSNRRQREKEKPPKEQLSTSLMNDLPPLPKVAPRKRETGPLTPKSEPNQHKFEVILSGDDHLHGVQTHSYPVIPITKTRKKNRKTRKSVSNSLGDDHQPRPPSLNISPTDRRSHRSQKIEDT